MLRTGFNDGGGKITRTNNDTASTSSITVSLQNTNSYLIGDGDSVGSSNYGSGNSGSTSNDSRDSEQGTHVINIAGKIYAAYQLGMEFRNSLNHVMYCRFAQTLGGTTSRYTSGSSTTGYSEIPLNYWNIGSSTQPNGSFTFTVRLHGHVLDTSSYDIMPHFSASGGYINNNGGRETVTTMGRATGWSSGISVFKNCIDRVKFFPRSGTIGSPSITIDAFSYEWLATDTTGT